MTSQPPVCVSSLRRYLNLFVCVRQLLDWSKSGGGGERLLTFYRLCDRIAERLKGLFVLFTANLVKPVADLLRRTATGLSPSSSSSGTMSCDRLTFDSILNELSSLSETFSSP